MPSILDLLSQGGQFIAGRQQAQQQQAIEAEERQRKMALEQALLAQYEANTAATKAATAARTNPVKTDDQYSGMVSSVYDPSRNAGENAAAVIGKFGIDNVDPTMVQNAVQKRADYLAQQERAQQVADRQAAAAERVAANASEPDPVHRFTGPDGVMYIEGPGGVATPDPNVGRRPPETPTLSSTERTAMSANAAIIGDIDDALTKLDANPDAVGMRGMVPDIALQRIDPQGVEARAALANVASAITLMRSGGAVSNSEFERIAPFLPQDTDTPEKIRSNLANLKAFFERKSQAVADTTAAPITTTSGPRKAPF